MCVHVVCPNRLAPNKDGVRSTILTVCLVCMERHVDEGRGCGEERAVKGCNGSSKGMALMLCEAAGMVYFVMRHVDGGRQVDCTMAGL